MPRQWAGACGGAVLHKVRPYSGRGDRRSLADAKVFLGVLAIAEDLSRRSLTCWYKKVARKINCVVNNLKVAEKAVT